MSHDTRNRGREQLTTEMVGEKKLDCKMGKIVKSKKEKAEARQIWHGDGGGVW